jgi:ABC-type glycerol-3-phosphate transport system permease component
MAIIPEVGRRSLKFRVLITSMYVILAVLGVGMAYPFLMTVTASASTAMDYNRFSPMSRSLWSREDRFVRGVSAYFPEILRNSMEQFPHLFRSVPPEWSTWKSVGDDKKASDKFAQGYLKLADNPRQWAQVQLAAADYDQFVDRYPVDDTICTYDDRILAQYFREQYIAQVKRQPEARKLSRADTETQALKLLGDKWGIPFDSFFTIQAMRENQTPLDQHDYWPRDDGRAHDFLRLAQAYRERRFLPGGIKNKWRDVLESESSREVLGISGKGPVSIAEYNKALGTKYRSIDDIPYAPAPDSDRRLLKLWGKYTGGVMPVCEARPFPLKTVWLRYLGGSDGRKRIGLPEGGALTIVEYNKAFGTRYATLRNTPFPVTSSEPIKMQQSYEFFVQKQYPLRLMGLKVTPQLATAYRDFAKKSFFGNLPVCNRTLKTDYKSWDDIQLSAAMPRENDSLAGLWVRFVDTLPYSVKIPHSAEAAYQQFLVKRYGSVGEVNKRYGWNLGAIEDAQMPFDLAYTVSFVRNEHHLYLSSLTQNYKFVLYFLLLRGRAVMNTAILIALTLLAALTVNPLAAYGLSRFHMKHTPGIVLFMLATMAFPAAVSMIPGYLLMRDLHLLNTYAALILPGVANGMSIFLLKGFFDSLPPELYEAAALDGAPEWMVFTRITLPLSKPILAVIALGSFFAAYGSWEWALIVCQKPQMWTLAVWLYQFNSTYVLLPWAVMAAFVLASLPVFIVFLLCQNIIMRGIILPQMK